jgi:hypothetical protein
MPTMSTTSSGDAAVRDDAAISAEILAAIAAAAAVFVGKRLRILGVEQLDSPREQVSRWSRQGRVQVQSSHNLPVKHPTMTR